MVAEAKATIAAAIELDSSPAEWHVHLGDACLALGELSEAEKHYRSALARDPRIPRANTNLALIYGYRGDFSRAREEAQRALIVNPGDPIARRIIARSPD